MSSLFDIERVFGTNLRPDVVMIFGRFGKRKQAIELCNDISIDLNLRQAYLNMREAEQRFTSTGDAVRQAEEDYRIASERYRAGEGILLDILDAQTALTTARQNALSARYDYARYRAQVESLMGKELSAEEHAAAEGLPAVTAEERTAARAAYAEGTDAAARGEKS